MVFKRCQNLQKIILASMSHPEIVFAKLLSLSDELMWRYIDLLSLGSLEHIRSWKKRVDDGENPKNIKVEFAKEIVGRLYDEKAAQNAEDNFNLRAKGDVPEDIEEHIHYRLLK